MEKWKIGGGWAGGVGAILFEINMSSQKNTTFHPSHPILPIFSDDLQFFGTPLFRETAFAGNLAGGGKE
jgi:hypothetical protein